MKRLIPEAAIQDQIAKRQMTLDQHTIVLPGSVPHDNVRPINVPGRFDGCTLFQVMSELHPHIGTDQWQRIFDAGRISKGGCVVASDRRVRGGEQFSHLFPNTVEPDVANAIKIIWEDDAIVVVNKPAPLPMHPSGRFNRNTLISLIQSVYDGEKLHLCHRLDANTTGVVLIARNESHARSIQAQFEDKTVKKEYRARCYGHPGADTFECHEPIGRSRGQVARRTVDSSGQPALTEFTVVSRHDDNTSTVIAKPITGRTNQIRIHLWSLGHAIVGDPLYLAGRRFGYSQTLPLEAQPMRLHAQCLSFIHPVSRERVFAEVDSPGF